MKTPVALVRCNSYEAEDFEPALDRLLAAVGGLESFVRPGERVLLKPNCITAAPSSAAAQTDPAVILGLARRVRDLGAHPVVGDSPAWGRVADNLDAMGVLGPLRAMGVEVVRFRRGRRVKNYPMRIYSHFRIATEVLAADKVINLPKLKAHKQIGLTAAIKNMFGCVPGKRKALYHFSAGEKSTGGARGDRGPGRRNLFGLMLVELFDLLKPCLTIVDGVLGQEGDGPIRGRPRWLRWLAGGRDGVAIERVSAELVGIPPSELRILAAAETLGTGQWRLDEIEVLGESIESLAVSDFARPVPMPIRFPLLRVVRSTLKNVVLSLKGGRQAGRP